MIPTDVRIKENELYQEVELFIGNTKVGEAEIEVTKHMLSRFVIYEPYQNKGYGRQALGLILDFIRSAPARQAKYVWLCYGLDNVVARKLYASIGFKEVPEAYLEEDEEMPAVLEL